MTAVLLISLATRVSVMWRLRRSIDRRRVTILICAAVPGLFVGVLVLRSSDEDALRIVVGMTVATAAAGVTLAERYPPKPSRLRGLSVAAGFTGGLLGTSTSLNGVAPALLLTRRGIPTKTFLADLATYFVATSALGLGVLALNGHFSQAGAEAFLWWGDSEQRGPMIRGSPSGLSGNPLQPTTGGA